MKKAPPPQLHSFWKSRGQCPRHAPLSGVPEY